MQDTDVYLDCPVYAGTLITLRKTEAGDAADLLKCYSDENAVPLFNSDNCNGDDFHYTTLDGLKQTMDLWEYSYQIKRFVRWSVVCNETREVVGTIECFGRSADIGSFALLRIDLRSDYETAPVVGEILDIADTHFFGAFAADTLITKAVPEAAVRLSVLRCRGYRPLEENFLIYDDYYRRKISGK